MAPATRCLHGPAFAPGLFRRLLHRKTGGNPPALLRFMDQPAVRRSWLGGIAVAGLLGRPEGDLRRPVLADQPAALWGSIDALRHGRMRAVRPQPDQPPAPPLKRQSTML